MAYELRHATVVHDERTLTLQYVKLAPSEPLVPVMQLFVFSNTGRNLASSPGALTEFSGSPTYQTQFPWWGNDLNTDPWLAAAANPQQIAGTVGGPASWILNFPPGPGYPLGFPTMVSSVVFINRCDGGSNTRMTGGALYLMGANFSVLSKVPMTSASVAVWNYPNMAQIGPIYPNSSLAPSSVATLQVPSVNQLTYVRFVTITSAPNKCLSFRELFAFDNTMTNVALYKPTSQSAASGPLSQYTDVTLGFTSFSSYGVDGIIDQDNMAGGNMVNLPCDGSGSWSVDLGGVYNLTRIILFNRFPLTGSTTVGQLLGANLTGATLTYSNAFGTYIGSYTLSGDMIQSFPVVLVPYTPSSTPSSSMTPSQTPSASNTPSHTASPSATISIGASVSLTPTGTVVTPSQTATSSTTPTPTKTPFAPNPYKLAISTLASNVLNFIEARSSACDCALRVHRGAIVTRASC